MEMTTRMAGTGLVVPASAVIVLFSVAVLKPRLLWRLDFPPLAIGETS